MERTILESVALYQRVSEDQRDAHVINALLSLWWSFRNASRIASIWSDIEAFHDAPASSHRGSGELSYSSILKSLLFAQSIDAAKCLQSLRWMERRRYRLSIHGAFLNKLIAQCAADVDLDALRFIHKLMLRDMIAAKAANHTAMIGAYARCGHVTDALGAFHSMPMGLRDVVAVGATMQVLLDGARHEDALRIFDESSNIEQNHITRALAIKACVERSDIDAALSVFNAIDHKQLNAVCVASIMKGLLNAERNQQALEIYNQHSNSSLHNAVTHLLAIKACAKSEELERGRVIYGSLKGAEQHNAMLTSALIDFLDILAKWMRRNKCMNQRRRDNTSA